MLCTVGAFKSSTSEAVADELAASRVNYVVRPHVASAALGTVTNRRLQDEVNAARKLELVASLNNANTVTKPSSDLHYCDLLWICCTAYCAKH